MLGDGPTAVLGDDVFTAMPIDGTPSLSSSKSRPSLQRKSTGFAFSCDEDTTMVESMIAADQTDRTNSVSPAVARLSFVSRPSR